MLPSSIGTIKIGITKMTSPKDHGRADSRLRTILSSWHQSPRYRSVALTQHRNRPVKLASEKDLDRELKPQRHVEWKWFLITLLVFAIIDHLCLPHLR
jgi:hypothetical protein